ncbi:MAG: cyclic nucleotide-binding domain-containing protein [Pseudomonadota bacterium]
MIGLDLLVNAANVIYLFSYSVRDILTLRILTVIGASMLLPYYYFQHTALWAAIGWNLFFIGVNIYWILRLLAERRPVAFTPEEKRLYSIALSNLTEHDAVKLLRMAERKSVPAGTELIRQGTAVGELSLIASGEVTVAEGSAQVDSLGEGNFLGAIAFLSQGMPFNTPVTVRSTAPTTLLTWRFADLNAEFSRNSDLQIAVEASLGLEISRWLQRTRQMLVRA